MNEAPGAEIQWPIGPARPALGDRNVDVWRIDLSRDDRQLQRDARLLCEQEQDRARRFQFDVHRHRFVARRAALRVILGRYVGTAAQDLRFETSGHGKPRLAGDATLQFNVSHSALMGLVAVARRREVGVDIESLDRDVKRERLARRFFCAAEADAIEQYRDNDAVSAFFACWTRKEAYVKARGMGLAMGLETFEVSVDLLEPATLLRTDDDPRNRDRWTMAHLVPGAGYLGALASGGRDIDLRLWHFTFI